MIVRRPHRRADEVRGPDDVVLVPACTRRLVIGAKDHTHLSIRGEPLQDEKPLLGGCARDHPGRLSPAQIQIVVPDMSKIARER